MEGNHITPRRTSLGAVHIITQLALKSFKLLVREKRCRIEQSVLAVGRLADTKSNFAVKRWQGDGQLLTVRRCTRCCASTLRG
jgi:hypothetical protein